MERREDADLLHSATTKTSESPSQVLPTSTTADLSPSRFDSGVGSMPTGTPSASLQSSSSSLSTSLVGPSGSSSSSPSPFFSNKGAVAGLIVGLSVLILSIFGIVYLACFCRRQGDSKQRKSRDVSRSHASVTFSTIMRRFDANPTNRGSEPRQTFSIQQTIPQSDPSHRISVPNVSGWLARRRERRSSQFHEILYHSRPPSVIEGDVKHLGEGTQWTLGEVLENQREQVIKPLPPVPRLPIKQPKPARSTTRALNSRGGMTVGESEGGPFTLEDALLSSSSLAYEPGSSRSGRHPYAQ